MGRECGGMHRAPAFLYEPAAALAGFAGYEDVV